MKVKSDFYQRMLKAKMMKKAMKPKAEICKKKGGTKPCTCKKSL
jgi:hypothetical protein